MFFFGYKNYQYTLISFKNKSIGTRMAYVKVASVIKNDMSINGGSECVLWATSFRPELSWYSGCYTLNVKDKDVFKRDFLINFRRFKYSIVFSKLSGQLNKKLADEYGVSLEEIFRIKASNSLGNLILYKINDKRGIRFEQITEEEPK